ncbi:Mitochondrial dicarboxylate transporter [Borealophlyctis nickersoniae]|nr:Mitochondrial dicarboxylate transporter [Borealophlyctis nickersoniae]
MSSTLATTTKEKPLFDAHPSRQTAKRQVAPVKTQWWFGGIASVAAALCTHPLDTLKIRMQTSTLRNTSVFGTAAAIVRSEGVSGLYAGLSASVLRQATYSTARFAVYDIVKGYMVRKSNGAPLSVPYQITAAVIGGVAGGIVGTPADLCNIRMQNDAKLPPELQRNYRNAFDGLFRIAREEGVRSLFLGLGPNVQRAIFMTAGQIASYDVVKQQMLASGKFKDDTTTHFASSLIAGLVATTICSPFDVLKTRIMSASEGGGAYKSSLDAFFKILRAEGPMAFLKGWVPSVASDVANVV